ncbi:MAG: PKD-like family lipoprotein [Bacteroidia bacterium]|nr:PKD-like family lipoprotein [Bacteroidia bacterium]
MKKIITYIFIVFLAVGCMKDLSNYDYTDLNKITISGIDTLYTIGQMDVMKMNPQLSFSMGEEADLSYEWRINYQVVSNEKTLNKPIGVRFGYWPALFTVTNNKTGVKSFYDFKVEILNPYGYGLFVLSEDDDESSILSFQPRKPEIGFFKEDIFTHVNSELGTLGKKPMQLFYNTSNRDLYVVSKEGDKNVAILNSSTIQPKNLINGNMVIGGYDGVFAPSFLIRFFGGTGIVSEGKFFIYDGGRSQALYRPVEGNYSLANYITANSSLSANYWVGYDKERCQLITFAPENDPYYFSKIQPWSFDGVSTANMKFVAGSEYGAIDYTDWVLMTHKKKLILEKDGTLHFFELRLQKGDIDPATQRMIPRMIFKKDMSIPNIGNVNSACLLAQKSRYWFIGTENKIYKVYADGGREAELWYTLERGSVKAMTIDDKEKTLFVAASVGSEANKSGDIIVLDAVKKSTLLEPVYKNVCKEPKSLIFKEK